MRLVEFTGIHIETGVTRKVVTRADDERELFAEAAKNDLIVTAIRPVAAKPSKNAQKYADLKAEFLDELVLFTGQGAGPAETEKSLTRAFVNADLKFRKLLRPVIEEIGRGKRLHNAFDRGNGLFAEEEIALISIAESHGKQLDTLCLLRDAARRAASIGQKQSSAFEYPKILAVVVLGSLMLSSVMLFPQLITSYEKMGIPLYPPLNIIAFLSVGLRNPLFDIISLATIAAVVVGMRVASRVPMIALNLDYVVLRLPTFGALTRNLRLLRVLYALDLMIREGEQARALDLAASVAEGPVFREQLAAAAARQRSGEIRNWAHALEAAPDVFPAEYLGRLANAEDNGKTPDQIALLIERVNRKIDAVLAVLPRRLEVVITIVSAVFVCALLYAIIIPTSYLTAHIHG
jgi:general secretion pathway protein F